MSRLIIVPSGETDRGPKKKSHYELHVPFCIQLLLTGGRQSVNDVNLNMTEILLTNILNVIHKNKHNH